jgi:hypothetical protein
MTACHPSQDSSSILKQQRADPLGEFVGCAAALSEDLAVHDCPFWLGSGMPEQAIEGQAAAQEKLLVWPACSTCVCKLLQQGDCQLWLGFCAPE